MIIGKNFGCTHFIISHDHASLGNSSSDLPFYQCDEATVLAQSKAGELGVDIIPFEEKEFDQAKKFRTGPLFRK